MAKPSRTIIWVAVGAVAVGAIVYLTTPQSSTATHHFTLASIQKTDAVQDANGITPADLTTHFARYKGGKRDPFVPGIATGMPSIGGDLGKAGGKGGWNLTGVSTVNGLTSAVIENGTSGDSVYLKKGDHWNGLQVMDIESDAVIFNNALGQSTTLGFPVPAAPTNATNPTAPMNPVGTASPALALPAIPSLNDITQPTAQPTPDNQQYGRRRGRRSRNNQSNTDQNAVPNESGTDQ